VFTKTTRKPASLAAVLAVGVALSACGTTPGERALSGGLLGAGTGAAIGSVTGSAGKGALIGGLGGAAIGALTSPSQINLGSNYHRCVRYSSYTGRCIRRS
jgi:osmotically inducible lipoprotein OsmB